MQILTEADSCRGSKTKLKHHGHESRATVMNKLSSFFMTEFKVHQIS